MHREESLRITNELARLTLPSQRNVDYHDIAHNFTNKEVKQELLQDEHNFGALQ